MSMLARYKRPGGFVQLLSLIETSGHAKREKFLEMIRGENASWAEAIERHSLSMDRIFNWSDEVITEIFKGLPVRNLACAIKGFNEEQSKRILNYLSHSEKRKIEDEMGTLNSNPDEFNGTVIKILEITRKMISDGQIRLQSVDPNLEIPEDYEDKLDKLSSGQSISSAPKSSSADDRRADQIQGVILKSQQASAQAGGAPSPEMQQLHRLAQTLTKENKSLRDENRILKEKLEQIKKIA